MATEVIMPKVDMDQESGTISEWKKHNGDTVKEGETILVIETAKVAIDVEAPASGVLAGITAKPGDELPIATVIGYVLEPGESLPATAKPAEAAPQAAAEPKSEAKPAAAAVQSVDATPVARNMAAAMGIALSSVQGTGAQGKITKEDVERAAKPQPAAVAGKVYATPAARRIAGELGVDLAQVSGSGPDHRIQAADVTSFRPAVQPVWSAAAQEDEVIPLKGMRATIAQRLTASYQSIPHIKFTARVDMTAFNQARASLNAFAEKSGGEKISATAMFIKITAAALRQNPYLNASLKEDSIVLHQAVHMGVAVALQDGLIVPVIHDVLQKGIGQVALETNQLSKKARDGQLQPADVSGGTFTISNLGPFGVEQFDAIINPPQSAILALGATQDEVVPVDGTIGVRPIMRMTLSADHRIVDGAVAAKFVADLKAMLENPLLLLY